MGKYSAVMTPTDRERITGEADVPNEKKYQAIHRVRSRIEELEQDAKILKTHHPELYEELHSAVCEDS